MVMPDERRRHELDSPASRLQPPAHVNVVAGTQVDRVEPADGPQGVATDREVAAGHVLRRAIVEEHVGRAAGGARDAVRDPRAVERRQAEPSRGDDIGTGERLDQIGQPVGIHPHVGIRIRHDVAGRGSEAGVACGAQAAMLEIDHAARRVLPRDSARAVTRAIVHDNDFEIRVGQPFQRGEALVERLGSVVGADDDRHFHARARLRRRKRDAREDVCDRLQDRLRASLGIDQAERPVVDGVSTPPPFVRPRKRHGAAGALGKRRPELHRGERGLSTHALPQAVGAGFGHEQRLVTGDVLQARQVRAEIALAMQVHVERDQVDERQVEVLGRRIVDVREERVGRDRLGVGIQLGEKPLDALRAEPAHDGGGDLVAERQHQDGRVRRERAHMSHDVAPDGPRHMPVVEERHVVGPRHPDHDPETVLLCQVQEPLVRHGIGAYRVHASATHQLEVFGDARGRRKVVAVLVRRERAVAHALDPEPLGTQLKEFPGDRRSQQVCRSRGDRGHRCGIAGGEPATRSVRQWWTEWSSTAQADPLVGEVQGCQAAHPAAWSPTVSRAVANASSVGSNPRVGLWSGIQGLRHRRSHPANESRRGKLRLDVGFLYVAALTYAAMRSYTIESIRALLFRG